MTTLLSKLSARQTLNFVWASEASTILLLIRTTETFPFVWMSFISKLRQTSINYNHKHVFLIYDFILTFSFANFWNIPLYEGPWLGTYGIKVHVWQMNFNGNVMPYNFLNACSTQNVLSLIHKRKKTNKKEPNFYGFLPPYSFYKKCICGKLSLRYIRYP